MTYVLGEELLNTQLIAKPEIFNKGDKFNC